jgi:heme/copper-type cytochrome/quinol oxidase subunit 1
VEGFKVSSAMLLVPTAIAIFCVAAAIGDSRVSINPVFVLKIVTLFNTLFQEFC